PFCFGRFFVSSFQPFLAVQNTRALVEAGTAIEGRWQACANGSHPTPAPFVSEPRGAASGAAGSPRAPRNSPTTRATLDELAETATGWWNKTTAFPVVL